MGAQNSGRELRGAANLLSRDFRTPEKIHLVFSSQDIGKVLFQTSPMPLTKTDYRSLKFWEKFR